jgi:hypothetical protein
MFALYSRQQPVGLPKEIANHSMAEGKSGLKRCRLPGGQTLSTNGCWFWQTGHRRYWLLRAKMARRWASAGFQESVEKHTHQHTILRFRNKGIQFNITQLKWYMVSATQETSLTSHPRSTLMLLAPNLVEQDSRQSKKKKKRARGE